jgi:hypothetical protein
VIIAIADTSGDVDLADAVSVRRPSAMTPTRS